MTMPTPQEMDDFIDHHERQITTFMDCGPDPRGPDRTNPWGHLSWPTRPLWEIARLLTRLGNALESVGYEAQCARARQIVTELHGRCQSPEELASMSEFIASPLTADWWTP